MPHHRLFLIPAALLALSACASPCQRIDTDMRQLNANAIRDPSMVVDGRYLARFQDLTAQRIENACPL